MCSPDDPMLESYTTLGHVAGLTERVSLGVLVTGADVPPPGAPGQDRHHPDAVGGPGAARHRRRGTSASRPASACRSSRWRSGSSASRRPSRSACRCGATTMSPVRRPPPPAGRDDLRPLVDQPPPPADPGRRGRGEEDPAAGGPLRRRLQRVREQPADVAGKLDVLRSHCDAEGRDYDRIQKTVLAVRPALADVGRLPGRGRRVRRPRCDRDRGDARPPPGRVRHPDRRAGPPASPTGPDLFRSRPSATAIWPML